MGFVFSDSKSLQLPVLYDYTFDNTEICRSKGNVLTFTYDKLALYKGIYYLRIISDEDQNQISRFDCCSLKSK
jgi:hypothetical protein